MTTRDKLGLWVLLTGNVIVYGVLIFFVVWLMGISSASQAELRTWRTLGSSPKIVQSALNIMDANERAMSLMTSYGGIWMVDDVAVECRRWGGADVY